MNLNKLSKKELIKLVEDLRQTEDEDPASGETPGVRSKTPHQLRIETFMKGGKQGVPDRPLLPNGGILEFRARIVLEEAFEFAASCGCVVWVNGRLIDLGTPPTVVYTGGADLVKIADGAGDLSVVAIGSLSACGIADVGVLEEIDRSNMDKVDVSKGATVRGDGKILKPKGWERPKLGKVLLDQGYGKLNDG